MPKDQNNTVEEILIEVVDDIQTRYTELKEVQNIGESGWFYFVSIRLDKLAPLIEKALQESYTAGMEAEGERTKYKCPRCDGDGIYIESVENEQGLGEIEENECWKCKGTGIYKPDITNKEK